MTLDAVRSLLVKRALKHRTKRFGSTGMAQWCRHHGVGRSHVSEFIAGKRLPTTAILGALGLEWTITRKPTAGGEVSGEVDRVIAGLSEAEKLSLTTDWDAFCDADWHLMTGELDGFAERLEAAGYAELVAVDREALEDPFAAERGIYPGGSMWQLTQPGQQVRTRLIETQTTEQDHVR